MANKEIDTRKNCITLEFTSKEAESLRGVVIVSDLSDDWLSNPDNARFCLNCGTLYTSIKCVAVKNCMLCGDRTKSPFKGSD